MKEEIDEEVKALKTGDEVMLWLRRPAAGEPGTILKANRIWLTIGYNFDWVYPRQIRMRRDTQDAGLDYSDQPRFYTMNQWARREADAKADSILKIAGVRLDPSSLFQSHKAELAAFVESCTKADEKASS